jgi:hypothetical protein
MYAHVTSSLAAADKPAMLAHAAKMESPFVTWDRGHRCVDLLAMSRKSVELFREYTALCWRLRKWIP